MTFHVRVHGVEDIKRLYNTSSEKAGKVLWFAITRAATAAKTQASKATIKKYYVKSESVKNSLKISKKNTRAITANLRSEGNVIPLILFDTSPKAETKNNQKVFARVMRKGGKKFVPGAFIVRGKKSNELQVVRRIGKDRRPLEVLYGPSIPQMIGNEKIMDSIILCANETLEKRLDHELGRLLRGEIQ